MTEIPLRIVDRPTPPGDKQRLLHLGRVFPGTDYMLDPGSMWHEPELDDGNRECWAVVLPDGRVWRTTDPASDPPHELWDAPPAEPGQREKISASRARNYARNLGWPPPLAWDDDAIADPDAGPAEGWQRTRDVPRGAELAVEAAELREMGVALPFAAERLGVPFKTLERAVLRSRERAA